MGLEYAGRDEIYAHGNPAAPPGENQRIGIRRHARHADGRMRLLVRRQMESQTELVHRLRDGEPPEVAFIDAGLGVVPDAQNRLYGFARHAAVVVLGRVETEHFEIAREAAGADAPHEPPSRHVVELGDAMGYHKRVVVGHARDAGSELDALRPRERVGDEQVRRGDVFPNRSEVFADPRLRVAQPVENLQLMKVILHSLRGVRPRRMKRHGKESHLH